MRRQFLFLLEGTTDWLNLFLRVNPSEVIHMEFDKF
jgi:hypothetical protein